MTEIKSDLKRQLEMTRDEIEKFETYEDVERFLDDALDIYVLVDLSTKELTGFNICLACGGPNVYWVYDRGYSKLEGYWIPEEETVRVDKEKADLVLDYLSEIYEF